MSSSRLSRERLTNLMSAAFRPGSVPREEYIEEFYKLAREIGSPLLWGRRLKQGNREIHATNTFMGVNYVIQRVRRHDGDCDLYLLLREGAEGNWDKMIFEEEAADCLLSAYGQKADEFVEPEQLSPEVLDAFMTELTIAASAFMSAALKEKVSKKPQSVAEQIKSDILEGYEASP